MAEERDPILDRVVRELSPLPKADPAVTARIVAAAMGQKAIDPAPSIAVRVTPRRFSFAAIGTLAAAAAIIGFLARGLVPSASRDAAVSSAQASAANVATSPAPSAPVAAMSTTLASHSADAPHPIQFVLRAPGAHRVALVGDFNGWDLSRGSMREAGAPGVWAATVSLRPGRHIYAYVVDDSVWTLDPRAPRATDPDFGVSRSVILVGMP